MVPTSRSSASPYAELGAEQVDESDARVLVPLKYSSQGRRFREFGDAVRAMKQESAVDFPLNGERSCAWLLSYIMEHGGTPDGRQT